MVNTMCSWLLEMVMSFISFILGLFGIDYKKKSVRFEDGGNTLSEPPHNQDEVPAEKSVEASE
jgi:hypothetical protein